MIRHGKSVLLSCAGYVLFVSGLYAQENEHPMRDQDIHTKFYENWLMPSDRSRSCCNTMDCSPAEYRFSGGDWFARKAGTDGQFVKIPENTIEHERDTPDGRSHLCARGESVYCFIPGAGG